MEKIVADIDQEWKSLSGDHERLVNSFNAIFDSFDQNVDKNPSHLITGVFGAGKTMFMVHLFKTCVSKGLFPIYVLAEDVFTKVTGTNFSDVTNEINEFVNQITDNFRSKNFEEIRKLINLDESKSKESKSKVLKTNLFDYLCQNYNNISYPYNATLFVDEFEDEYKKSWDRLPKKLA